MIIAMERSGVTGAEDIEVATPISVATNTIEAGEVMAGSM